MIRPLLCALLLVFPAGGVFAEEQGQLDGSPVLFSVLAALNATGFSEDLDSPSNHPLRKAVTAAVLAKSPPVLPELRAFIARHKRQDPASELGQYISFALSVEGPPDFKYRYPEDKLLPAVAALAGFNRLMEQFHREAGIDDLWRKAQPAFDEVIGAYHEKTSRVVLEANAYLRNPTSGFLGRRFQIYLDLLGPPNQVHTRSFLDDYFVVITPSTELKTDLIRQAYLQYLLDPLFIKYSDHLQPKKALIDYAQPAPALGDLYKADFGLLSMKCLIRAVEARLAPAAQRQAMVDQALREGYILTPYFAEALVRYEKQEEAMRLYLPDMVDAIDLKREEKRLEKVEFASAAPVHKVPVVARPETDTEKAQRTIQEAEQLSAQKNFGKAKELLMEVAKTASDRTLQARAYYGMARIAALENDPESAEKLFQQVLDSQPDPATQAWSHVYLARLSDLAGEREEATRHYQAALAVQGASPAARKAAEEGLKGTFQPRKE